MAGAASVLEDDSTISRIDRGLCRIEKFFALLSGLAVFGLMFLAVISVSGRQFFNRPLAGYVDWIELTMPFIAFLGVSYLKRTGGHIRMDIVIGQLSGRALWLAEFVTTFCILILILLLIWGSWAHFDRSFDFEAAWWSRDSTIDIGMPIWPAKLVVPFAFAVLAIRLVMQLWGYGRAFVRGDESPVAVPLIMSTEEIAKAEADALEERS